MSNYFLYSFFKEDLMIAKHKNTAEIYFNYGKS